MAASKLLNPKRKRRAKISKQPPFPVPIATLSDEVPDTHNWFYYTGVLRKDHVVVKHTGDMDFLYRMGFFGKGTLSRSQPDFQMRERNVRVPDNTGEITHLKVASKRSYVRHMNWRQKGDGDFGEELLEFDSSQEDEYEYCAFENQETTGTAGEIIATKDGLSAQAEVDRLTHETENCSSRVREIEKRKYKAEDWQEADDDFWGCSPEKTKKEDKEWKESANDFWDCRTEEKQIIKDGNMSVNVLHENKNKTSDISGNSCVHGCIDSLVTENQGQNPNHLSYCGKSEQLLNASDFHLRKEDQCNRESIKESALSLMENFIDIKKSEASLEPVSATDDKLFDSDEVIYDQQQVKSSDNENQAAGKNVTSDIPIGIDPLKNEEVLPDNSVQTDPLCVHDEENGDLFVVDDSDSETEGRKFSKKTKWLPVIKKDPFPIKEDLHLSFEESFFLSYGLGCLLVKQDGKELDLCEMWRRFFKSQKSFLAKYVAYQYFRSIGWVPKSGLKFGTDFVLYKVGPPFYHGSYSVLVRMVDEGTLRDHKHFTDRDFSWIRLAGLNRATEHVAKELMICYVIKPDSLTDADLQSPKCISYFKVKLMTISRWISSQEREGKTGEEMP